VLRRWTTQWWARWLAATAAVVLVLVILVAIGWALLIPLADALAHHDVGSVKGSLLETARDAARGRLLTLAAGVFAAGALAFTARTFYLSQRTFNLSQRTFELTEQGQVTGRYTKAIEQLGSDKLDVRIGGIYALERIALDSPSDHPTVVEVLTAFIREHSREPWTAPGPLDAEPERSTRPDVQAALTVVGRRDAERDIRRIDLAHADLPGAHLDHARLDHAGLGHAHLRHAMLAGVHLGGGDLYKAHLYGAFLGDGADLTGAMLAAADLTTAYLRDASLAGANLRDACLVATNLIDARLVGADLTGANLRDAHLAGADLTNANLTRAGLADVIFADTVFYSSGPTGGRLRHANLSGARWPEGAQVPEGWKLDISSGRLKTADTSPGPEEVK
jgi:uncharacterized protein YjbI with pentapeptide repeats